MVMDGVGNVRSVSIEDEMRSAYIDYAMSVIVARALPDVRDGLKPVHRRILYTMHEMGLRSTASYRKCAGVVGESMAKYHPHGDLAIYDTLVRMAQDFSLRYPLVDGQGNFGSVDGDPPAAMRYTEARMAAITDEMLADIEKETVDFTDNYDGRLREPSVMPARLPNLLVNGSSGIAVGMATNIPPHNLNEILEAVNALIENPELTVDELSEIVTGPDFPTGGTIFRFEDQRNSVTGEKERVDVIRHMYATGRGRVIIRGQVSFEEIRPGRMAVVVTELPYQVNKTTLIEKMAELVGSKRITDVSDIRDESDRTGMRIVVEVKRDGSPHTVMQQLFKHTALQTSFSANMLALVDGQPQTLGLKRMLEHYIAYRRDVIRRRTEFELARAQERAHILEGLKIALDNLDEVIKTIRAAADVEVARTNLMKRFKLTEVQANAILEMQLRRLAALERKKIEDEYRDIIQLIATLEDLLANPRKILEVIKDELAELKRKYGDERKTRIQADANRELTAEDLVAAEDVVVTLSQRGYIKRQQIGTFRSQRRGGKGKLAMITREEDAVRHLLVANTHDYILFFTNRGRVFITRVHTLPEASRQAKGLPIINLPGVQVDAGEYVSAIITLPAVRARPLHGHGHAGRDDQEDLAGRIRQDPRQRADRDQPGGRRRAPMGGHDRRPERRHPGHSQGAGGPLPRARGARHGPRHPRRDRHPAQEGRRSDRDGDRGAGCRAAGRHGAGLRQAHATRRVPGQAPGHRWRHRQLAQSRHRRRGRRPRRGP